MTHPDLQELLGAYALDAVSADEALVLEAHLADCPGCRAEVAAHRETAAKLGNAGGEAPPQLWDRIAAELPFGTHTGPPMPGNVAPLRRARRRGAGPVAAAVLSVAAAAAIALLAVSTVHLQHRVDALRDAVGTGGIGQAAAAAALNPLHSAVRLESSDGRLEAEVVTVPGGRAYLIESNLPSLVGDRTYQLWGVSDGGVVSLGLLGPRPQLTAFQVDRAVTRLMVTAEPQGGRPVPDSPVLIQGAL